MKMSLLSRLQRYIGFYAKGKYKTLGCWCFDKVTAKKEFDFVIDDIEVTFHGREETIVFNISIYPVDAMRTDENRFQECTRTFEMGDNSFAFTQDIERYLSNFKPDYYRPKWDKKG